MMGWEITLMNRKKNAGFALHPMVFFLMRLPWTCYHAKYLPDGVLGKQNKVFPL